MTAARARGGGPAPAELAVVVTADERPIRLRWLLNALEEQTLPAREWVVTVVHDASRPDILELLQSHPLVAAGVLRQVVVAAEIGPARMRNAGWRATHSPRIVFTREDCRPPRDWLERLLLECRSHPGAVVQGATRPDPNETSLLRAAPHAWARTLRPPSVWEEGCNVAYPRDLLERADGFREGLPAGAPEHADLVARVGRAGAPLVPAPSVVMYHAVHTATFPAQLRTAWHRQHVAAVVRENPELRCQLPLWLFWRRRHVWLPPAALGALLTRRHPVLASLAIPWAVHAAPAFGSHPRERFRSVSRLPRRALLDLAEMVALARGSVRYRTLVL